MASSDDKSVKQKLEEFLNQKNYFTDGLAFVEGKTGVNRLYLFLGVVAFLGLYLVVGYASHFVVAILGFVYPAYCSVKAIESENKDDDTQWLTYWVVYGTFSIVEFFSDILLSWFPLYFLFKCMFLGWCMAPFPWNGADFIYNRLVKPFVVKHQKKMDQYLEKAKEKATEYYHEAESKAKEAAIHHISAAQEKKEDEDKKDD